MEALRQFAAEYGEDLTAIKAEFGQVHGIELDFDRAWLARWQLARAVDPQTWHTLAGDVDALGPRGAEYLDPDARITVPADLTTVRDAGISALTPAGDVAGGAIIVRFVLVPGTDLRDLGDRPFPYRVVHRPLARAAGRLDAVTPLVGGVSAGDAGGRGTLGGVLAGPAGTRFGLGCAHVLATTQSRVNQPSAADNPGAARPIGLVQAVSPLTAHVQCRVGVKDPNRVDAALVALDPTVASALEVEGVGPIDGVGEAVTGEPVQTSGKHGLYDLYVGPLAALYDIVINRVRHCFDDLITVYDRVTNLNAMQRGDSGAWVVRDNAEGGKEWCGVVVGIDHRQAYAVRAARVLEWLDGEGYTDLTPA